MYHSPPLKRQGESEEYYSKTLDLESSMLPIRPPHFPHQRSKHKIIDVIPFFFIIFILLKEMTLTAIVFSIFHCP